MGQRPDTIKLEENIGRMLFDINHNNMFLDLTLKAKKTRVKISK